MTWFQCDITTRPAKRAHGASYWGRPPPRNNRTAPGPSRKTRANESTRRNFDERGKENQSGYGMLAIVAVLLVVIVSLFIWSIVGMAGRRHRHAHRRGWGLGGQHLCVLPVVHPVERFLLAAARPGARMHPLLWQIRGLFAMRGSSGQTPSQQEHGEQRAGIGEMLELEMSDQRQPRPRRKKPPRATPPPSPPACAP